MEALVMEELDANSYIVRKFRHDYHLSANKQMIEQVFTLHSYGCEQCRLHSLRRRLES